jgi:hypothetical protein
LEKGEIEMEYDQMFRQMMAFNKTTFDNGFNALVTLQEQNEKMANTFLEQAPWLPGELRNVIDVWLSTCKNGRGDFKRAQGKTGENGQSQIVRLLNWV